MNIERETGIFILKDELKVSLLTTQRELVACSKLNWEGWPDKDECTASFRLILNVKNNKQGKIYFIVNFEKINEHEPTVTGWMLAPENLISGEQHRPKGKVTKALRQWFFEMTNTHLPVSGAWGHIDAAYDPHNQAGSIVCNYRTGFNDEKSWADFLEWNPS